MMGRQNYQPQLFFNYSSRRLEFKVLNIIILTNYRLYWGEPWTNLNIHRQS